MLPKQKPAEQHEHLILETKDGFPAITDTEVAVVAAPHASPATLRLAEILRDFCSAADPRKEE